MANYLLLYSGGAMPETEAEQKAVLTEWQNWFAKIRRRFSGRWKSFHSPGKNHFQRW